MKRRYFLAVAPGAAMAGFGLSPSSGAIAQPRYKVSAAQLERVIASRFPARFPVANLFNVDLEAPRLRLLPELNRLASQTVLQVAGPALRGSLRGSFDVDFALRYEAADQSIRAHELRVQSIQLPGLPPDTLKLLDGYAKALARQALLEVVLHRLQPRDLAVADAMGLQPGDITVTPEGLTIGFTPKPMR